MKKCKRWDFMVVKNNNYDRKEKSNEINEFTW